MKDYKKFPTLSKLFAEGTVWEENGSYIGKAADGEVVALGTVGYAKQCEDYLTAYPTPDKW